MPRTNGESNLKQPVDDSQNDIQVMNELCQVLGDEIPVLCCNVAPEPLASVNGLYLLQFRIQLKSYEVILPIE